MRSSQELLYVPRWDKEARPFIDTFSEPQWGLTPTELLWPYFHEWTTRGKSSEKLSISSISCTPAARCGAPTINLLAGLDTPFACAPSQQTPSSHNLWRTGHNKVSKQGRIKGEGNYPGPPWWQSFALNKILIWKIVMIQKQYENTIYILMLH